MVILARQCNIPSVLGRAFYEVIRTPVFGQGNRAGTEYECESSSDEDDDEDDDDDDENDDDENGLASEADEDKGGEIDVDGVGDMLNNVVSADGNEDDESEINDSSVDNKDSTLSRDDICLLVDIRERLTNAWVLAVASAPRVVCRDPADNCDIPAHLWVNLVHESGIFRENLYDPLNGLQKLQEVDWLAEGLCKRCIMLRNDGWSQQQDELRENLDLWLDL
jgi:hypothetical protein